MYTAKGTYGYTPSQSKSDQTNRTPTFAPGSPLKTV